MSNATMCMTKYKVSSKQQQQQQQHLLLLLQLLLLLLLLLLPPLLLPLLLPLNPHHQHVSDSFFPAKKIFQHFWVASCANASLFNSALSKRPTMASRGGKLHPIRSRIDVFVTPCKNQEMSCWLRICCFFLVDRCGVFFWFRVEDKNLSNHNKTLIWHELWVILIGSGFMACEGQDFMGHKEIRNFGVWLGFYFWGLTFDVDWLTIMQACLFLAIFVGNPSF